MREPFSRIELADRDRLLPELSSFRFVDLGFAGLYYCAEAFDIGSATLCGALCLSIRGEDGSRSYVLSDVSSLPQAAPKLCELEGANAVAFDFVEQSDLQKFETLPGYSCRIEHQEKYADYYSAYADYIAVDKRAAPHKYKDYNRFCKNHAHATRELTLNNLPEARALLDQWCADRDCDSCTTGCERRWILRLFDAWDKLPVKGLIADADGEPAGFCVAEQNGETLLRLVGKPVKKYNGLNVFMGIESAKRLFPGASYVNLGPDSGVEGIREYKEKFSPYIKLEKYRVTLKRLQEEAPSALVVR